MTIYKVSNEGVNAYFASKSLAEEFLAEFATTLDRLHFLLKAYAGAIRITQEFSTKLYDMVVNPTIPEEVKNESGDIKPDDTILP